MKFLLLKIPNTGRNTEQQCGESQYVSAPNVRPLLMPVNSKKYRADRANLIFALFASIHIFVALFFLFVYLPERPSIGAYNFAYILEDILSVVWSVYFL
jgi:hypothetical protein